MPVQGYLDWPRGRELIGWAWDSARPGHRLHVEIRMDGVALRNCVARSFRADLPGVGIGDGFHAFSLELPGSAFNGDPHTFEAIVPESGEALNRVDYRAAYFGEILSVAASVVRIRVGDSSRPDAGVETELYADGRLVTVGYPPDLRLPAGFEIDRVQRFELRAHGCAVALAQYGTTPAAAVLTPRLPDSGDPVDIVISAPPNATTCVLRTLESLAACGNRTVSRVYVTLKAEEGVLRSTLEEAQSRLDFDLGSPTEGETDSVVLAPGSLVSGDWLDRLRAGAYSDPGVATVSPVTGGPREGKTGRMLDRLCTEAQPDSLAEIFTPSPVCHYRRVGAGSIHLLAGGVYVESFSAIPPMVEDRYHAAHRLRRTPAERKHLAVSTERGDTVVVGGWRYRLPEDGESLAKVLPSLTIDSVLWPAAIPVPYEVIVQDYGWICPRGDLIDETGRYCGEPSIEACERCFGKLGPRDGWGSLLHRCTSVAELREQSRQTLEGATLVRFPSRDAAERIGRYAAPSHSVIAPDDPPASPPKPALRAPERLRIELAGPKGVVWDACVLDARKRELPIDFSPDADDRAHVAFFASDAPALRVPKCRAYPVRFAVGVEGPGLRIPAGLPGSRINDILLREFFEA